MQTSPISKCSCPNKTFSCFVCLYTLISRVSEDGNWAQLKVSLTELVQKNNYMVSNAYFLSAKVLCSCMLTSSCNICDYLLHGFPRK